METVAATTQEGFSCQKSTDFVTCTNEEPTTVECQVTDESAREKEQNREHVPSDGETDGKRRTFPGSGSQWRANPLHHPAFDHDPLRGEVPTYAHWGLAWTTNRMLKVLPDRTVRIKGNYYGHSEVKNLTKQVGKLRRTSGNGEGQPESQLTQVTSIL